MATEQTTVPVGSRQWRGELLRMTESLAWPTLREWWQRTCLDRAMTSPDPMAQVLECAKDYSGGLALLLAIENATATGDIDGRITANRRAAAAAQARSKGSNERGNAG